MFQRILERVRVMLRPRQAGELLGKPGARWRDNIRMTFAMIVRKSDEYRVKERAKELGELGWEAGKGALQAKQMEALRNAAEAEERKADAELKRRTLEANARKAAAEADSAEVDVKLKHADLQLKRSEFEKRRLEQFEKMAEVFRKYGAVPILNEDGSIDFVKFDELDEGLNDDETGEEEGPQP